ncbi:MAG: DUF4349 domain-containing protein [Candidatus Dojkabacteria bacterium]|nr:DUF4349 domain-containing protein [Candidatus Dojkabacteria bacterium]
MKKGLKIGLIVGASVLLISAVVVTVIFVSSIRNSATNYDYSDGGLGMVEESISPDSPTYDAKTATSESAESTEDRDVIRNGTITVSVDDIDATVTEIDTIKGQYSGEITYMVDTGDGKDRIVTISLKVAEEKFDEVYNKLKTLEGEYTYSGISANDVTETVVDLEARLKNLRSVERQYLEILKSANTVKDTLLVYEQLNTTRANIESIEASLEYYARQTDYSTIYMTISQSSTGAQLSDDPWEPLGVLKDAGRALVNLGKFLGSTLIWILVFSPVIAIIVVPIILIQRKKRK